MSDRLLDELAGSCELLVDRDLLEGYRRDQAAPDLLAAGTPLAVARPSSTGEVQRVVRAAARHRVPIVPRGAGSGLSGGANAIDGGLVLSLERMRDLVAVDRGSMTATVGPGVVNATLKAAAAERDLLYAPDPASHELCTIGGNVATNAGGLCCVKYGVTRDALLGLEAVLADGRAVRLGRRTRKGVAGYDLVALLCGSEGTLAIVTEATVRLLPRPPAPVTLAAAFATLGAAGRAIARIVRRETPAMLEIMDAATVAAVEAFRPMGLGTDAAVLVFARSDVAGGGAREEAERIAGLCEAAGATLCVVSEDQAEGEMLLAARRLAYPALERQGATLLDDVAVPLDRIPHLLDAIPAIGERHGLTIGTFGHAGDGNMHPTIVFPRGDPEAAAAARAAFAEIVALALRLGGTIAGEHGVGALKRDLLAAELGAAHDVHRAVKRALDPQGLLNPGKGL